MAGEQEQRAPLRGVLLLGRGIVWSSSGLNSQNLGRPSPGRCLQRRSIHAMALTRMAGRVADAMRASHPTSTVPERSRGQAALPLSCRPASGEPGPPAVVNSAGRIGSAANTSGSTERPARGRGLRSYVHGLTSVVPERIGSRG